MGLVKEWEAHGFRCRVLDGPFKNYNGYVAIPKGHPYYGKSYDDMDVRVHGGLTFDGWGGGKPMKKEIFGKKKDWTLDPENWPDPELWWVGWDTSHLGDFITYSDGSHPDPTGMFWTVEMVERETTELARQLSEKT